MAAVEFVSTLRGPIFDPQAPRRALEELRKGVLAGTVELYNGVLDRIPTSDGRGFNTGVLKRSISFEAALDVSGRQIEGAVGSPLIYAPVIEDGRQKGKPISREGVIAIGLWAVRKLGVKRQKAGDDLGETIQLYSIGYPFAQSIKAKGIKGIKMFARAAQYTKDAVQARIDAGAEGYRREYGGGEGA